MRTVLLSLLTLLFTAVASFATSYNYITPEILKAQLAQKKQLIVVDIQVPQEFSAHHLTGSLETNAFPAKTPAERQRLDRAVAVIKATTAPVIVVCPRGKGGAKNAYEYIVSRGVPENRVQILEGGMAGWPFKEFVASGR